MKKVFLFLLTSLLSLSMQAKVGLLIPDSRSAAETAAATWFESQYGSGNEIAMNAIPTNTSEYTTIWVMVDRTIDLGAFNGLFGETQKANLTAFVKAGGNLLLCKQATMLAYTMGRIGFAPEFATFNSTADWGGQGRAISLRMGSCNNDIVSDQTGHEIYAGESGDLMKRWEGDPQGQKLIYFAANGISDQNYRYCSWIDLHKNAEKTGKAGNGDKACLTDFQNAWEATVLGIRGKITDYCYSDVVLFNAGTSTYSEWRGNILTIGSASYWWGQGECVELTNLKKLTSNSLNYLESLIPEPEPVPNPAAATAFLLMANTVDELPSVPEKNAANEFAKKYFTTDAATSQGRYLLLSDLSNIPSTVKTIIIHADRETLFDWSSYKENLKTWVKERGGNLVLLRQATILAYDMHRIDYAPHCQPLSNSATSEQGEEAEEAGKNHHDKIRVKIGIDHVHIEDCSSYSPCYVDRSGDGLFDGMTIQEDGENKLIILNDGGLAKNRCYWQSMRYDGTNDATYYRARFDAFETRYNCEVLAVEGYVQDFCLASIIRFKKGTVPADGGANWKGTILAIGAGGFQYTDGNTAFDVLNTLIRNAVESLKPSACDNCFRITF